MLYSRDAKDSPCLRGRVETGRQIDGGINGAWDEYLFDVSGATAGEFLPERLTIPATGMVFHIRVHCVGG